MKENDERKISREMERERGKRVREERVREREKVLRSQSIVICFSSWKQHVVFDESNPRFRQKKDGNKEREREKIPGREWIFSLSLLLSLLPDESDLLKEQMNLLFSFSLGKRIMIIIQSQFSRSPSFFLSLFKTAGSNQNQEHKTHQTNGHSLEWKEEKEREKRRKRNREKRRKRNREKKKIVLAWLSFIWSEKKSLKSKRMDTPFSSFFLSLSLDFLLFLSLFLLHLSGKMKSW